MSTAVENKSLPDSQIIFQSRRKKAIEDCAKAKFGKALIQVSVNREEERFDVLVKEATESDAKEFEALLPMSKVEILKSVPRKK